MHPEPAVARLTRMGTLTEIFSNSQQGGKSIYEAISPFN